MAAQNSNYFPKLENSGALAQREGEVVGLLPPKLSAE
jgi:hypothetical protein